MNLKINIFFYLQMLVCNSLIISSYQEDICPDKCRPCLKEAVVCETPGRTTLPESISTTVERLTMANQRFSQTSLSSDNFTQFATPHISLKQLVIRYCNIELIEAHTFSTLTKLVTMDLSNNSNLKIASDAFSGLKLRYLQINNANLKLGLHAFRGLEVTSLSLSECSLDSISYELLHPLGPTLTKLFLNNNRLKVLDASLQLIFQKLDSLDLTGNPIACNCDMRWLMTFYRENLLNPNFNDNRLSSKNSNLIPRCGFPVHVHNTLLTDVTSSQLNCGSPFISQLYVEMSSLSNVKLTCSGYQSGWKAPMQISWFNINPGNELLGSELFPNGNISSKEVSIQALSEIGKYKCVINNTIGEVTATVKINWPDIVKSYIDVDDSKFISGSKINRNIEPKTWSGVFFKRRFTLLEILAAVFGTIIFTALVFILMHRFVLLQCWFVTKKNQKISSQQSNLATVSLTTSYEPGVYSNSQTYDLPGPDYASSNLQFANLQPDCTPQQFLDFKTQRKIYRKL